MMSAFFDLQPTSNRLFKSFYKVNDIGLLFLKYEGRGEVNLTPPEKITFKMPGFISFKHDECYVKNKNGLDGIFGWFPSMVVFSYLFPLF